MIQFRAMNDFTLSLILKLIFKYLVIKKTGTPCGIRGSGLILIFTEQEEHLFLSFL